MQTVQRMGSQQPCMDRTQLESLLLKGRIALELWSNSISEAEHQQQDSFCEEIEEGEEDTQTERTIWQSESQRSAISNAQVNTDQHLKYEGDSKMGSQAEQEAAEELEHDEQPTPDASKHHEQFSSHLHLPKLDEAPVVTVHDHHKPTKSSKKRKNHRGGKKKREKRVVDNACSNTKGGVTGNKHEQRTYSELDVIHGDEEPEVKIEVERDGQILGDDQKKSKPGGDDDATVEDRADSGYGSDASQEIVKEKILLLQADTCEQRFVLFKAPAGPESADRLNIKEGRTAHHSDEALYKIQPVQGKGCGVIAKTDITKGTRIMCEEPLLLLSDKNVIGVPLAFARLSPGQQKRVLELSSSAPEEELMELKKFMQMLEADDPNRKMALSGISTEIQAAAIAIVNTNAHAANEGSGVFAEAARINHSCVPNVYHSWNSGIGRLTVHAVRDIVAGEELLTSYIPAFLERSSRQQHLTRYGFACRCMACDLSIPSGRESLSRRRILLQLDRRVSEGVQLTAKWTRKEVIPSVRKAVYMAQQRIYFLEAEGVFNMELCRCYHEASVLCSMAKEHSEALDWARKAVESALVCNGADSEALDIYRQHLRSMESAAVTV